MHAALLLLLVPPAALAADRPTAGEAIPLKIERFLEHSEVSRRGALTRIEHELRGLRRLKPLEADAARRIADLETQRKVLLARDKPVVGPLPFPPQVGDIGRLPNLECRVEQILSDREFVAACSFPVVVTTVRDFRGYRERVNQSLRLVIRGLPTQKLEVGASLQLLDVFEVSRREAYPTTSGRQREMLVVTPFDMKQVEAYFARSQSN
jgi:hypothetical protein